MPLAGLQSGATNPQTPSTTAGTAAGLGTNPSFASQIAAGLYGGAAPTIGQGQVSVSQALAQAGVMPAELGVGAANLTANTGFDIAGAILNQQGIGLQSQLVGEQAGTAAQQQQLELGQYGVQQQQLGLDPQSVALEQALQGSQEKTAAEQYGVSQSELAGGEAAAGATGTVGNQQQKNLLAQQYATTQAGFTEQTGQQGLELQSDYLKQQLAALGQQSEQVGYQGQQEQYANAQAQLGVAAQQAGIPVQQAQSQLAYGLQQLGVQADPTQLIAQAATGQSGVAGDYASILQAAAAFSGMGAQSISSILP